MCTFGEHRELNSFNNEYLCSYIIYINPVSIYVGKPYGKFKLKSIFRFAIGELILQAVEVFT